MATETIIGNYRIGERIGRGGMGIVYRGHHLKLPREVAIKSISASTKPDLHRLRSRFEKEAFIQSQLDHPGIVKIYDYIVAADIYGQGSPATRRESHLTQPIKAQTCPSCGAATGPSDIHCRQCGRDLVGSSATVKLTRREADEFRRKRSVGLQFGAGILVLALGGTLILFLTRRTTAPAEKPQEQISATAAEASGAALLEIKPASVVVDSSYDGYTAMPLTDNEIDVRRIAEMKYNEGNRASAETQTPHWIELSFDRSIRLAALYIYGGFDRNRFMPSRRAELQIMSDHERWQTISRMEPDKDYDRMAFEFAPVSTTRVRVFQPAQQGPPNRPFIMWVREVKVFRLPE